MEKAQLTHRPGPARGPARGPAAAHPASPQARAPNPSYVGAVRPAATTAHYSSSSNRHSVTSCTQPPLTLPLPSPRTTCGLAARARPSQPSPLGAAPARARGSGAGARPWRPRCGLGRSGAAWPGPMRSLDAASCAARGVRPIRLRPRRGARSGAARPLRSHSRHPGAVRPRRGRSGAAWPLRSPCPGAAPCQRSARPVWHVACSPSVTHHGARCPRRGPAWCAGCPARPAVGVLVPRHGLRGGRQRSPGVAVCVPTRRAPARLPARPCAACPGSAFAWSRRSSKRRRAGRHAPSTHRAQSLYASSLSHNVVRTLSTRCRLPMRVVRRRLAGVFVPRVIARALSRVTPRLFTRCRARRFLACRVASRISHAARAR
jgi:hypothetical protein